MWWAKRPMAMRVLRGISGRSFEEKAFAFFFQSNHGWRRGKVTLKKKAADEQFQLPPTTGSEPSTPPTHSKFTHASQKTKNKKNERHLYAHEPQIGWELPFIVKKQKNAIGVLPLFFPLVWILRSCNLRILKRVPPREKLSTFSGDAIFDKSRMKRKNPTLWNRQVLTE